MLLENELQSIISGTGDVTNGNAIKAIANYLKKSKATGKNAEEEELIKEQETKAIILHTNKTIHNLYSVFLNR